MKFFWIIWVFFLPIFLSAQVDYSYADIAFKRLKSLENQPFISDWIIADSLPRLAELDKTIADPLYDRPDLKDSLLELSGALQTLQPDLQAHYEWLSSLNTADLQDYLAAGTLPIAIQQVADLNKRLGLIKTEAKQVREQVLLGAQTTNSNLHTDDAYTVLEKDVNAVYLNWRINENELLSDNDMAYIESIAILCPQNWGEAVLKARSIWLQNGGGFDKRWEECFPIDETVEQGGGNEQGFIQGEGLKEIPPIPADAIIAYPVPVSDAFVLAVPDEYIGSDYAIYNSIGINVSQGQLKANKTQIDATHFNNGLHFIRIRADELRPITLTIVVQKL